MKNWSLVMALLFIGSLVAIAPGIAESRIVSVSASDNQYRYSAAVNDNGTVWVWGTGKMYNATGSILYDTAKLTPILHPELSGAKAISNGYVLKHDGTVWAMGHRYIYDENGECTYTYDLTAHKLDGFENITAISSRGENLIALKDDGTVWMIGNNCYGQLGMDAGYGDTSSKFDSPVQAPIAGVKAVSMGNKHAVALKYDGTVWAWGMNNNGQLGDATPVMVKGLTNVTAIDAGREFTMALRDDGTVWTWGSNTFGQLGDGLPAKAEPSSPTPVQVKGLTNVVSISAGEWFALALRDDGTVWAWGDNRFNGMLGDGTMESRNVPVQTKNLSGIVAISSSIDHCLALDKYGVVWAWGRDDCGQLGDGEYGPLACKSIPFKVPFSEALSGPAVEPGWMGPPRPGIPQRDEAPDNDTIVYMATGDDGVLYAFTANGLTALDQDSHVKWNLTIPGRWMYDKLSARIVWAGPNVITFGTSEAGYGTLELIAMRTNEKSVPAFTAENGYVYLYAIGEPVSSYSADNPSYSMADPTEHASNARVEVERELIAVSPDGKISWSKTFKDDIATGDTSHVEAHDGRIYLYHNYNETVFDSSGKLLFNIEDVSDPVSVGDDGSVYAMRAARQDLFYHSPTGEYFDYRTPSNVIEKYDATGQLCWSKELAENASRPYVTPGIRNEFSSLPIYREDTLYVPLDNGIMALNKDGIPLWTKKFDDDRYRLFYLMPMDTAGNMYFFKEAGNSTILRMVKPDGSEITPDRSYERTVASALNGVLYSVSPSRADGALETGTISAYDMASGRLLWSFTAPIGETRTVTVNESNVNALFSDYSDEGGVTGDAVFDNSMVNVMPSGHVVYVYFRTMDYEAPVVLGQSKFTYASALYALDNDGRLIWQKPTGSFVTTMAANNSTIYYSTGDGKIYTSVIGTAAGLAIIGAILVAAKFFLFGSVTRVRSKLDKNENRNRIHRFIAGRPGSTLYELSKELGMNIGTLRYHLMVLGLNHRVVTYNDGKFVRYFTNSNTYSKEDRMVISLARRETIREVLKVLLERDEATNVELCDALSIPDSAASKYLGELVKKGVVARNPSPTIRASYSINTAQVARVDNALRLIEGGIQRSSGGSRFGIPSSIG